MVGPDEIYQIMENTGLSFEQIVQPYPEMICDGDRTYTIGWIIRRVGDRCIFLDKTTCTIYEHRPWICKTYPFALDQNELQVHPCTGLGTRHIPLDDAEKLALALTCRSAYEHEQDEKILFILRTQTIPPDRPVVIDAEGIKDYHG
jgi:Fe-S-cluster containining protein